MKTTLAALVFLAMLILLVAPGQTFAQAPDTVKVYANPPGSGGLTIEKFISGDTTATGTRKNPNRVYFLQQTGSLDTEYYYYDPIFAKSNINILGKVNPVTGHPPVIQPMIRADNSAPSNFISSSGKNVTFTLRNLYFLGTRYDSVQATGDLLVLKGDTTTVIIDHCVIDQANGNLANFNGNWNKYYLTNTEYRNGSNQFWQSGNGMWATNGVPMDTVVIHNNTFFCMGRAIYGGPAYYRYLIFDHNTCFLGTGGLLLSPFQSNAVISNNIFYGVIAHGCDSSYIKTAGANAAKEGFGVVMMDSLAAVGTKYGITEAQRKVVVTNNVYYWPQAFYTYWKSFNDTSKTIRIVPPYWMNQATVNKFNDKVHWPGISAAHNDSTDPGFPASIAGPAVDSLVKFVKLIGYPAGNAGSYRWWQLRTDPYPTGVFRQFPTTWNSWSKGYPVPENMRYTNTALQTAGSDGKALGDLNWFPEQLATEVEGTSGTLPATYELSNNYPNPFNPSTQINYSVPRSGFITLKVYNLLGQDVATLFSGMQKPGNYIAIFDASRLTSGVYFYRLEAGGVTITKKLMMLK